jgi:hypothetical protein
MILPKEVEVALRFAMIPLAVPAPGASQEYNQEIRGAFIWYFSQSHNFKWTTDVGYVKDTTSGAKSTIQLRTQGQVIF